MNKNVSLYCMYRNIDMCPCCVHKFVDRCSSTQKNVLKFEA